MEGQANETQVVKPLSELNIIDPIPGAAYVSEDYKAPETEVTGETAQTEPATTEQNTTEASAEVKTETKPDFDFDSFVKEKTGGKFEKWDDVLTKATSDFSFENETSKKVFDYIKEGKFDEVGQFLIQKQMLSGLDKMEKEDLIRLKLRLDDPDATAEDIEDDFTDKFGIAPDKDDMEPEEYRKALRKYNRAVKEGAESAMQELGKLSEEIKLPDLVKQAAPTTISPEDISAETMEISKQLADSVANSIKELNALNFQFEDKDKGVQFSHDFKPNDIEKAELNSFFNDFFESFESRYKTNGGNYDGQKLAQDFFFVLNRDKIVKSAVMNALNQGKFATAASIANVNVNPGSSPAIDPAAEKRTEAIRNFILG